MAELEPSRFRFGLYEFDTGTRELRREGVLVRLQAQPAQVLGCLIARAGQVVSREDLREAIWHGDTFVDFERGLNFCISQVRSALKDDSAEPRYIRTIPKQGYQFISPLERIPAATQSQNASPIAPAPARNNGKSWGVPLLMGAVVLTGIILATAYWLRVTHGAAQPPVVAVLRFDNETGNPDLTRFSDGLTDNVVEQLTAWSSGRYAVIGNAQILRLPREQRDLTAIASSLHANFVVLGQVQSNGAQLRILAHLIRLPGQTHIWVARMDRPLVDPLSLESELARKVADEFSQRLMPGNHAALLPSATH